MWHVRRLRPIELLLPTGVTLKFDTLLIHRPLQLLVLERPPQLPNYPLNVSIQEPRFSDGCARHSEVHAKCHFWRKVLERLYQDSEDIRQSDEERDILFAGVIRSKILTTASFLWAAQSNLLRASNAGFTLLLGSRHTRSCSRYKCWRAKWYKSLSYSMILANAVLHYFVRSWISPIQECTRSNPHLNVGRLRISRLPPGCSVRFPAALLRSHCET